MAGRTAEPGDFRLRDEDEDEGEGMAESGTTVGVVEVEGDVGRY